MQAQQTSWITHTPNAKVRFAADPASALVATLPIGTALTSKAQTSTKRKVGEAEDYWYQVDLPNRKSGWVFGAALLAYPPQQKDEVLTGIMRPHMRNGGTVFTEEAAFLDFLALARKDVQALATQAEFDLARLVVIKRMLKLIPADKVATPPYKNWLKQHEEALVVNEQNGTYALRIDLLWDLESQYTDLPFAERIVYEASRTDIAGDCHHDLNCVLARLNLREGHYLSKYPNGVYVQDVLTRVEAALAQIMADSSAYSVRKADTAAFIKEITDLKGVVMGVQRAPVDAVVDKLGYIELQYQ